MIVEFVRVSEQGFSWTPIFQTGLGTFGGFVFGLIAFGIQQWFQRRANEKERDNSTIDALKRLLSCASSNIETIAMLKIQLIEPLEPEVKAMEDLVEKTYEDEKNIKALAEATAKLRHFFQTLPRAYELDPPAFSELSRVVDDMPGLTIFTHRGMSSMKELEAISSQRNDLIAEHAKENAAGMNSHRLLYFMSMLTGQGRGLIEMADNAMAFFMLVVEQVESYLDYGVKLEGFTRYRLVDQATKRLPAKNRFPEMRRLLVDFNEKHLKRR